MAFWAWVLLGFGLLAVEMATSGGLFALFFGAGALVVAVLAAIGVADLWQWVAFPLISVALLGGLRRSLQDRLASKARPEGDEIVGEQALLLEDVAGGAVGKAELRGSPWSVKAADGEPLKAGQRARVERVDGLTLYLRAEDGVPGEKKWKWQARRW